MPPGRTFEADFVMLVDKSQGEAVDAQVLYSSRLTCVSRPDRNERAGVHSILKRKREPRGYCAAKLAAVKPPAGG